MPNLSCDTDDLVSGAKCFCFDAETRQRVELYLLAVAAGLSGQTPAQLVEASKCYCFDRKQAGAVNLYLLCQAAAVNTVQDMLFDWLPTTAQFGEYIGIRFVSRNTGITDLVYRGRAMPNAAPIQFGSTSDLVTFSAPNMDTYPPTGTFSFTSNTALRSVSFAALANTSTAITITGNSALLSVSFPALLGSTLGINCSGNAALATIDFPLLTLTNSRNYNFSANALTAAGVNQILARGVASASYVSGTISLDGGTNSAPSGQGVADKATLIGRGCTVNTN